MKKLNALLNADCMERMHFSSTTSKAVIKIRDRYSDMKGVYKLRDLFLSQQESTKFYLGLTDDLRVDVIQGVSVVTTDLVSAGVNGSAIPVPFASCVLINESEHPRPYLFTALYEVMACRQQEVIDGQPRVIELLSNLLRTSKKKKVLYPQNKELELELMNDLIGNQSLNNPLIKQVVRYEESIERATEYFLETYEVMNCLEQELSEPFTDLVLFPLVMENFETINKDYLEQLLKK